MTQVQMSKEEAEKEMLNWLEAEKDYKESKLSFEFSPALILATYAATYCWGIINNNLFKGYYHHLKHIRDWLTNTTNKSDFNKISLKNYDLMYKKDMIHFYDKLETYCGRKNVEFDSDKICDAIDTLLYNHEFNSDFIITTEVLIKDIIKEIPHKNLKKK